MSDRDELMQVIKHAPSGYDRVADAVIEAGFRRTVTPEQIDSASDAAAEAGESQHRKCHQGCCWPLGIHVATEAAARAFGLVPEEEPKLPLCGDFVGDGLRCDQPQGHVGRRHSNRNW